MGEVIEVIDVGAGGYKNQSLIEVHDEAELEEEIDDYKKWEVDVQGSHGKI